MYVLVRGVNNFLILIEEGQYALKECGENLQSTNNNIQILHTLLCLNSEASNRGGRNTRGEHSTSFSIEGRSK